MVGPMKGFPGAAGEAVKDTIPVPFLDKYAGWAVSESLHWLHQQAGHMAEDAEDCKQLHTLLNGGHDDHRPRGAGTADGGAALFDAVRVLDLLTDQSPDVNAQLNGVDFSAHRLLYVQLRDAIEEACYALAARAAHAAVPVGEALTRSWWHVPYRVWRSDHVQTSLRSLCEQLEQAWKLDVALRVDNALQLRALRVPPRPGVGPVRPLPPLQLRSGPAAAAQPRPAPEPPAHVFQHCDSLVPWIEGLLAGTRNIGLVGMGGIGKTTIAQALYARAARRFDDTIWLTVGGNASDMLPLLRSAFAQLFPGSAETFETAEEGLSDIAHRLTQQRRSVLLVLDDVWPSTQHAVVAALNFATRANARHQGSRLLVTTRQRSTLSYDPLHVPVHLMDELHVAEVPALSTQHAQQLFYHHAFGAFDAAPPKWVPLDVCAQLIAGCGGNPLALEVLGGALSNCASAEQWAQRLDAFRWEQQQGSDRASAVCAVSVAALPPSLRECFVDFGAFLEDERVAEADAVHLFATRAPLHTPTSVAAAKRKLDELVQRSLVAAALEPGPHGRPTYRMHDILRSLARRYAAQASSGRCFDLDAQAAPLPGAVRYFSAQAPGGLARQLAQCASGGAVLRACVLGDAVHRDPAGDSERRPSVSAPRLRYLRSGCRGGCALGDALAGGHEKMPVLSFVRLHGCRGAAALLQHVLPAVHLLHLDLSGCAGLTDLPERLEESRRLTHLNLSVCMHLECLPDRIGNFTDLVLLDLSLCKSLTALPDSLGDCRQLEFLDLTAATGLQHLPCSLGRCSKLSWLDLRRCKGLSQLPDSIGQCSRLEQLYLTWCHRLTRLPESIRDCRQLAHLDLSFCESLAQLPDGIGSCSHLTQLDLTGCGRLASLPDSIGDCRQLAHLYLRACQGLKYLPERVGDCEDLEYLDLLGCGSLGQLPKRISGCTQLAILNLYLCKSLTQLPEGIGSCKSLKTLNLGLVTGLKQIPSLIECRRLRKVILNGVWLDVNPVVPEGTKVEYRA